MAASADSPNSAFAAAIVDAISGQTDMRKMWQNRAIGLKRSWVSLFCCAAQHCFGAAR
jgi:hypothetical protein